MTRRLIAAATTALLACGAGTDDLPPVRVTVPPGAALAEVTDTLVARGVVRHQWWFKTVARIQGLDRSVKAGVYDFVPGTSAGSILATLAAGREAMERVTIPEGLTVAETAELLAAELPISPAAIVEVAHDSTLVRRLSTAGTVEGYLFPETYTVRVSIDARGMVATMVNEFRRHWLPEWDRRLDSLGLTRDQVVTLASIVEGEARAADERAVISGVYHNRLRLGMRLQADPTVQYAIQQATGSRKTRLLLKDYEFQSPYNTYLIKGLPPGPISSPGSASIVAALYPADVPYLYFVADSTGRHVFTRTYREHVRAIARIRGQEQGRGQGQGHAP